MFNTQQVQLRCAGRTTDLPFELSLHDPKGHLETVAENRKFAKEKAAPHTYNVVLPKTDTYFPILKYKCTQELRPVPIVRTEICHAHGLLERAALTNLIHVNLSCHSACKQRSRASTDHAAWRCRLVLIRTTHRPCPI
jgi:hypothetical protein